MCNQKSDQKASPKRHRHFNPVRYMRDYCESVLTFTFNYTVAQQPISNVMHTLVRWYEW